jgi:ABC-type Fe3+-hydroxamate transport system substrate-binding protein
MRNFILLAFVLLLSACGTTGPVNLSALNEPIPADKARIVVTRNSSLLYLAAAADVRSNGAKIASLGRGGSIVRDVPKGQNTLSVSTPTAFGQFTVNFNAKAGQTYNFEVSPRSGALITGSAWGMAGDAINASISEQSGYFQIDLK